MDTPNGSAGGMVTLVGPTETPPAECIEDPLDADLRQGDLFQWLDGSADPYSLYGVIVTADCDIAQEKHRGILSYVPVLRLSDYLSIFYLPRQIERVVSNLRAQFTGTIRKRQEGIPDFLEPISDDASMGWLRTESAEAIADTLGMTASAARTTFLLVAERILSAQKTIESGQFEDLKEILVRLRVHQAASEDKVRQALGADFVSTVENLPGDAFFIGKLTEAAGEGYVAYLRFVREIPHGRIATRVREMRTAGVVAKRVARLTSPFVYRLTQQLADVFCAIGLPESYEVQRRRIAGQVGVPIRIADGPHGSGEASGE